jgi:phospholipid/cholesterol/gamma-HCH transport system ATP-binding protein
MPSNPSEIVVEDLHKSFDERPVLKGVSLSVERGEMLAIVGGSGSGKTVLLKHITGHFAPDQGRVLVADHHVDPDPDGAAPLRDLSTLDESGLDHLREHWAIVFQRNALLTGNVFLNLATLSREVFRLSDEEIMPKAQRALTDVGLEPELVLTRDREQLSGGMAKRVAIARALMMDPVLILYDEPTSGLDPDLCAQIHELMLRTHETQPELAKTRKGVVRTSVIVTHDTALLHRLRPRVVMLYEGAVLFDGPYEEFAASSNEHIQPYLGQMANLHVRNAGN